MNMIEEFIVYIHLLFMYIRKSFCKIEVQII